MRHHLLKSSLENYPSKMKILWKNLPQEEIKKINEYIDYLLTLNYEEVKSLAKTSSKHWEYITKFFSLPKTAKHTEFITKFIDPEKSEKQKIEESEILKIMTANRNKFIDYHNIDYSDYNEVKYQVIKRFKTIHNFWEDEVLLIWIPYFSQQHKRDKFWYQLEIYKSKTPELFTKFVCEMRRYKWNAFLTSNKK